jgi:hypothetical protein
MRYHNALHRDDACVSRLQRVGSKHRFQRRRRHKDCILGVHGLHGCGVHKVPYPRRLHVSDLCEHLQSSRTNSKLTQSHPNIEHCITREQWRRKHANPPESVDSVEHSCSAVWGVHRDPGEAHPCTRCVPVHA